MLRTTGTVFKATLRLERTGHSETVRRQTRLKSLYGKILC